MRHDWTPRGYALDGFLGSGGTAQVWRARVLATGARVALKRIPTTEQERAARAREEAALLAALDHPNIVRLHHAVRGRDCLVLVLDLADRGSLRELLQVRGRLTAGEVVTALSPVAAALAYLHGRAIVHGDVSAANVLFTDQGRPLLADVGVARLLGDERPVQSTPMYVDPAVAAGALPSPASDVFMLGALAFHALTGDPLWRAPTPIATFARAVGGVPADTGDRLAAVGVPPEVAAVVLRALDAQPAARGSAIEWALDLRHAARPVAVEFAAGRATVPPREPDDEAPGTAPAGPDTIRDRAVGDDAIRDRVVGYEPGSYPPIPLLLPTPVATPGRPAFVRPGPEPQPQEEPPTRMVRRDRPVGARELARRRPGVRVRRRDVATLSAAHSNPGGRHRRPGSSLRVRPAVAVLGVGLAAAAVAGSALAASSGGGGGGGGGAQRPRAAAERTVRPSASALSRSASSRSSSRSASSRSPSSQSDLTRQWAAVLTGLDAVRARAYATRQPGLLTAVYVEGPLLRRDVAQLQSAVPTGCGLTGAATSYRVLTVQAAPAGTTLTVRATLPVTHLVCGGAVSASAPAVDARLLRIQIVQTAAGPRIADETLS